jgi:sugar phosphate isomerase/epimerase
MSVVSRRRFLDASVVGLGAAAGALRLGAKPLGLPIGCQVFPVRLQLVKDFDGTLRELKAIGYEVIEFCSPPSFVTMDFGPLVGMKASEIRKRIEDAGLRAASCHFQFPELKEHMSARIDFAKELGIRQMVVATFSVPRDSGMDAWSRAADESNQLGEQAAKAGLQLGFHNHGFEFRKIDGVVIFDELMRRWDPKLVMSQFQVSVISGGTDPVAVLNQYPGRFISLHLQDWSAETKRQAAIGQGSIDWKRLFPAAKTGGIENYYVEMNMDALKASAPYLRALEV